jgi:hypothetical protein
VNGEQRAPKPDGYTASLRFGKQTQLKQVISLKQCSPLAHRGLEISTRETDACEWRHSEPPHFATRGAYFWPSILFPNRLNYRRRASGLTQCRPFARKEIHYAGPVNSHELLDPRPMRLPTPALQCTWQHTQLGIDRSTNTLLILHHVSIAQGFVWAVQISDPVTDDEARR